ncbi:MAG: hypothetical protein GYA48_09395 [Chloroflexi bacterium]|nr:hypothetical protein [Chloroflexota bacterium]
MEQKTETATTQPPRLVSSLGAGFNTVANSLYLILFPVILDLFLWVGPRLSLKQAMESLLSETFLTLQEMGSPEMLEILATTEKTWQTILQYFNLFSSLRSFPIGIGSLLAGQPAGDSPLGARAVIELPSLSAALGMWIILAIGGVILGSIYFSEVARFCTGEQTPFSFKNLRWQTFHSLAFSIGLVVLIVLVSFPVSIMVSIIGMINATFAQVAIFAIIFLVLWLMLPLFFVPHGIFLRKLNILRSILNSVRLVRFVLPSTSLFILVIVLLSQGMNLIWLIAPADSWMTLVGILGHAFVATGLLAASYIYYRDGSQWMEESIQSLIQQRSQKA